MADTSQAQKTGGGEGAAPCNNPSEPNVEVKADQPTTEANKDPDTSTTDVSSSKASGTAVQTPAEPAKEIQEPAAEVAKETETPVVVTEPIVTPVVPNEAAKEPEAIPAPAVEVVTEPQVPASTTVIDQSNENGKDSGDWQKREQELLKKIEDLQKVQNLTSEDGLRLELKVREEEIELLRARVRNLETELQAALSKPAGKNHEMIENIKLQHEDLLSKARGMIFDKTKMVKNQELQIEALTTQVQSLKDINVITKDLLEIRNSEVKAMEERLQAMEARFQAEKQRHGLVLQRAQTSNTLNDDLRAEYETQLAIFKELREKYEQKTQALIDENQKLKESIVLLKAASSTPRPQAQ